ncbi:SDR family oxidoreductase [Tetragenococcus koreensis]|uniref:SDR family NAD(P)-dependent oxidoreductase n=1 Tax=Tetragenococcus koreensis TaxID=290335 RepID=UPI001F15FE0B|nr:SDR family NAD(P)-dependent oxidoreductase [Tetragenococcus koreensis]MCF1584722.1 SDR family oxidoreductase [Tetragenococcus koreensis]MCF1614338.1 SDR family oxidoreductase [Tetragenococcus koreensis]MCF1620050.1 SDR family oxidoreductase [Tetragenococcus koreensis]MCF1624116.1 SDR family oxidoreductase [Tetragenococcus koreensis]MCF1629071.1 SDR family oxidoreductase [Tetragenococcus koreensis]
MENFAGKVVLITGAANNIGKGIALKFAKAGANTVIVDYDMEQGKNTADEITQEYVQSLFIQADVSDPEAMLKVREEVFNTFNRIDVLVLNAGIGNKNRVNDITYEEWNKMLSINLTGLFNTVKVFYEDFLLNKGAIVYIGSGSALSGTGGGVPYPASKAGGEGLMRGLAKELGSKGVNVNTVAPRLIDTGMLRVSHPTQESLDKVIQEVPVGRLGTIEDIANLTYFLADPANSFIQGQTILLDGGRTIG